MNRLKPRPVLQTPEIYRLEHANHEARRIGQPFDTFVTIHPGTESASAAQLALAAFWNWLRIWSNRKIGGFTCLLIREAEPNQDRAVGVGEHWHILVHLGQRLQRKALELALRRRWTDPSAVDVRPILGDTVTAEGKIQSAFGYASKQRCQQATWGKRAAYRRQRGGKVLGKRWRVSANLRPASGAQQVRQATRVLQGRSRAF